MSDRVPMVPRPQPPRETEVDRFHREQPAIPIPRHQITVPAPRGAIAFVLLGGRVISRHGG